MKKKKRRLLIKSKIHQLYRNRFLINHLLEEIANKCRNGMYLTNMSAIGNRLLIER